MNLRKTVLLLILFGLLSSCSQNGAHDERLCMRFVELNRGKEFDGLYNVAKGGRRETVIYHDSINKYEYVLNAIDVYDNKSDKYLLLPLFKRDATKAEMESTYKTVSRETKLFLSEKYNLSSETRLLESYIEYIKMIYSELDNIEVPEDCSYINVLVEGHPRTGKFITFYLSNKCKIYYVANDKSLNKYWEKYFKRINKIDDNWYYEIINK